MWQKENKILPDPCGTVPESLVRADGPVHAEDGAWRLVLVDFLPLGRQRATTRPRHPTRLGFTA